MSHQDGLHQDGLSLGVLLTDCFLVCVIQIVERDPMLFDDDVIKIEPVEGDIWPNSSFEVNVVFKPREAVQYTRTAFCDITGRQSRLPLRIRGDGAGPKVWITIL